MTLHVTDACNLACTYCYQERSPKNMTEETARKAVDLSVSASAQKSSTHPTNNAQPGIPACPSAGNGASTGICFFGGEPLLMRDLIINTVDYCTRIKSETGHKFSYKLVTNGTLLDEDFLCFADASNIGFGFSHDGLMQDDARLYPNGSGTADLLNEKIKMLLAHQPNAMAMCTVRPASAGKFADSVAWLFEQGFRRINTTPAIGDSITWTDEDLTVLEEQYRRISQTYIDWTLRGERFSFPAFDTKIEARIMGDAYRHKTCRFGQKQVSIAPDGSIYPCIQFVGMPLYRMGDVFSGISPEQKSFVIQQGKKEPTTCSGCALRNRCKYNCCCQNKHMTGQIDQVSPFTCNHEKLLIRYADEAANELFERKDATFLKKQYESRLPVDIFE
jgi:uncharacterized protein